jgi:hypothetical protein
MAASLTDKQMTMADVVQMLDIKEQAAIQSRRDRILTLSN